MRLFDSGGNTIIGLVPKASFEVEIDEIMQEGFIVRIQNGANTVYREGVVVGKSTQGGFRLGTLSSHGLKSAGNFSNDDAITFISKGRHPLWSDFATQAEIVAGTEGQKFITPLGLALGGFKGYSDFKQQTSNPEALGSSSATAWVPVPRATDGNDSDSQAEFTITPQRTGSKIIVLFIAGVGWVNANDSRGNMRLTKSTNSGSTWNAVSGSSRPNIVHTTSGGNNFTITAGFADSPNTTSEVRYRAEVQRATGNTQAWGFEGQFCVLLETM